MTSQAYHVVPLTLVAAPILLLPGVGPRIVPFTAGALPQAFALRPTWLQPEQQFPRWQAMAVAVLTVQALKVSSFRPTKPLLCLQSFIGSHGPTQMAYHCCVAVLSLMTNEFLGQASTILALAI